MRICILTQPLYTNYGGLLQAYALQTVLKRMGHEVLTEDRKPNKPTVKSRIKQIVVGMLSCIPFQQRFKKNWVIPIEKDRIISGETNKFIRKYIGTTVPVDSSDKKVLQQYNFQGYVVGSDQIWRPRYSPCLTNYFLDFTRGKDVKRIAYAASFGTDEWEFSGKQTQVCASLIQQFDALSVREAGAVNICQKHLGVKPVHVLDPTMLLEREDYEQLVKQEKESQSPGNLFCYILDTADEKQQVIRQVEKACGLKAFFVMPKYKATEENIKNHLEDCIFPRVTQWLRAFMDAEMVVTDSFHGCAFSIIFNKPFWVIGNKKRGLARFHSLLVMFGLEDRLIEPQNLQNIDWQTPVDWDAVNEQRRAWQKISFDFLNRNLAK